MKKLFNFLSLLIAFLFLTSVSVTLAEGFNGVHTPDGNYVIAVGDQGRIFRSVNSGDTWASYTEASANFKSVFTLGTNVWMTTAEGKVYKSSTTSSAMTPYLTGVTTPINSVFFLNANKGYICGDNGVLKSTVDGGATWTSSNTGISNTVNLNSVYFKDSQNGVAVGSNGSVYITINEGSTWSAVTVPTTRNLRSVKYFSDGIAVAGEWGTLLLKPTSSTWSQVATRINTDIRSVAGTSLADVHVCGGGGFIRNNKNNSTKFLNFEKNPMLADLVDMIYSGNKGFAVSSMNNAIIRTLDAGISWTLTAGTTVAYSWSAKPGASGNFLGNNLCLHPTDRNTVFIAFGNQVYRSGNKGDTWNTIGSNIPSGNTPHSFYVSPLDTNIWLVAIAVSGGDKVFRSTNYGGTWTAVITMNFSNYGQPLEMDQNDPHTFYFAPDNGGFHKSTDDGATFTEISGNYPFRSPCDILVEWDNSNVVFVADGITGSGTAKLYKSVNAGVNWTLVNTAAASEIPSMSNTVFDPATMWTTEWSGSNIYKSTNNGDNWTVHHSNTFSGWGSDICHEDPTMMLTGSWGARATISLDAGETWTDISSGLSGHGGGILVGDRGYILAHQGSNIYKLNVLYSIITSVSENTISSIPKSFDLSQNYPNPFNPSTKINYDLPKSGNVVLKVYNQLGKEVSTLVNSYKNAGSYELNFDGSNLSSGIYFYKLEADGLTATKKMLLIK